MGKDVPLRGVNIGSWLLIEPYLLGIDKPGLTEKDIWDSRGNKFGKMDKSTLMRTFRDNWFTENDVQKIAALDMNCVRIPIWWRATNESDNYDGSFDYINQSIKWCNKNGLYVILDLHGAPGGQNNYDVNLGERHDPTNDLWNNITFQNQFVEWWNRTADLYKNESIVAGYDILNEGTPTDFSNMIDLYNRTYYAIRNIDRNHIIILEVGDKSENHSLMPLSEEIRQKGWTDIVYSFHYYPTDCADPFNSFETDIPRLRHWANQSDVPIYIGEFNTIEIDVCNGSAKLNSTQRLNLLEKYLDTFEDYGWSWTFWSYKKIERDREYSWGLYGYENENLTPDFENDSLGEIETAFRNMRTENLIELPAKAVFEKHRI
jgi:aryl-phospho-beta-D-glucosidase BglC (GH1 family)